MTDINLIIDVALSGLSWWPVCNTKNVKIMTVIKSVGVIMKPDMSGLAGGA